GTLILSSDSKVLYTTSNQSTMDGLTYSNVEHDGGTLSQGGAFTVDIFTNTSGNFVASEDITASGIVWTAGSVNGTPSQSWDIGEDGLDINGGIFVATSDTFTVAGDWDIFLPGAGTFISGTGTVIFDGTAPQSITSADQEFYSIQNSNTTAPVSIEDKFKINASGTLTIDENATFATAGNEFNDNDGTITNNGTFQIHGDETFSTGNLSIPGFTEVIDPAGCTITTDIGGLEDVEFNSSGQTFSLNEDIDYITGDITIAVNTTFNMGAFDLTLADRKTMTNEGIWSVPSSGSQFTCSGNATFLGEDMIFSKFYAVSANTDTIIFKGTNAYTISDSLTLGGIDGGELLITSDEPLFRATAIINNTGDTQSIDYAKVYDVNGTEDHHIAATNSWSLGGTTNYWDFGAMLYTFTGTGIWDDPSNWEQDRVPAETDNIQVLSGASLIINGNKTINNIDIEGILDIGGDTLIVNGNSDVSDSIHVGT
ncbi:uncharacterized protein METZ01_LOCUS232798, partial [marine metagenome]